ncbi:DNA cytosine methyltransferase [Terasakiella sp. A23]|uniref:DNA cytosine methyltransferase n=1 Tax=Terasakiella sp. FCG-A23 TaxID=3080561 RepID=UPI002953DBC0|nr:DNA cytosine methyltransferase [Terasakiella sp. A23]MDV7341863.1 DNA cytosine methyltransferase [Terasakiella sp. A23]
MYKEDITKLSVRKIKNLTKKANGQVLFSACAPCQPFSSQNKQKSDKDERRALLDTLHPFIKSCLPDYILLENVPGLQRIEKGPFTRFINFLETLGYYFDADVKNAVDFGVPQRRKRLVLIASKHGPITLPEETHGKGRIPYKTVWQAIRFC